MDIGDGRSSIFWEDRWLGGWRIQEIAPKIYDRIPMRVRSTKKVFDALHLGSWAGDIGPDIDSAVMEEYIQLCMRLAEVQLDTHTTDNTRWAWEVSSEFSARSAYAANFVAREVEPYAELACGSRAP